MRTKLKRKKTNAERKKTKQKRVKKKAATYEKNHYCPRNSFNISKSNKLIVTHQN